MSPTTVDPLGDVRAQAIISIRKGIRKAIGKEPEDTVHVEIVPA
ncbi:DUF1905 domain-containing protein [Olsenella sp. AGMB03486]